MTQRMNGMRRLNSALLTLQHHNSQGNKMLMMPSSNTWYNDPVILLNLSTASLMPMLVAIQDKNWHNGTN